MKNKNIILIVLILINVILGVYIASEIHYNYEDMWLADIAIYVFSFNSVAMSYIVCMNIFKKKKCKHPNKTCRFLDGHISGDMCDYCK